MISCLLILKGNKSTHTHTHTFDKISQLKRKWIPLVIRRISKYWEDDSFYDFFSVITFLNSNLLELSRCSHCWLRTYCAVYCDSHHHSLSQSSFDSLWNAPRLYWNHVSLDLIWCKNNNRLINVPNIYVCTCTTTSGGVKLTASGGILKINLTFNIIYTVQTNLNILKMS